jgi:succinoglycan biosynthesis transport protein ExoP
MASFIRRRWLAFSVFALVLAFALSFAKALPSLYQSTATVLVERPASPDGSDGFESRLQTIRQEILSRARLVDLIGRFNLYPKLRAVVSQEAVVDRMRRDIRVEAYGSDAAAGRGTISFSLAYRGRDPQNVTLVANALASSYIEEDTLLRKRQTSGAASVLKSQLDEVRTKLAPQEAKIADFKRQHAGELPQQTDASFGALERLETQAQKVAEQKTAATERRLTLMREGNDRETASSGDPDRSRLEKLTLELADMRTRFSDKYPDVVRKMAEVESLAALVALKPRVDASLPQLEQVNREIRGLQAEETRLRGEIANHQSRIKSAPWLEQEYQALSRDYASTRDFYGTLLKRYEEAQLAEVQEGRPQGQSLRLLDAAIAPTDPLAPDRLRLAMFGLIVSLGLAVVAVGVAERLDTSFHSVDDLKAHTLLPILARIPKMPGEASQHRGRERGRAVIMTLALMLLLAVSIGAARRMAQDNDGVVTLLAPRGRS